MILHYTEKHLYMYIYTRAYIHICIASSDSHIRVRKKEKHGTLRKESFRQVRCLVSTYTRYHIYKLHLVCNRNSSKNCKNIEYKVHVWPKTALYSFNIYIYTLKTFHYNHKSLSIFKFPFSDSFHPRISTFIKMNRLIVSINAVAVSYDTYICISHVKTNFVKNYERIGNELIVKRTNYYCNVH